MTDEAMSAACADYSERAYCFYPLSMNLPLIPSFSPSGGEGARRAVEGDSEWFKVPMHGRKAEESFHEPHEFQSPLARRKRRSTAEFQDAGALATAARTSARFWSAPPLRRCGALDFPAVHGPNARHQSRGVRVSLAPLLADLLTQAIEARRAGDCLGD